MSDNKVAVIGLDGMAWQYLDILFDKGAMPSLKGLVEKGARGVLKSTVPPTTAPAWTTLSSGVNPGKHGAFDFMTLENGLKTKVISSEDVQYPRIHEMLAIHGLKSLVVNLPLTYPIRPFTHVMIIPSFRPKRSVCYPDELRKYAESYPEMEIYKAAWGIRNEEEKGLAILAKLLKDSRQRTRIVIEMIQSLDWNLFWVVFSEPDALLHNAYDHVVNCHPQALRIFNYIDEVIGEVAKIADLIVVVSDHGFRRYRYIIRVNTILHQKGLARVPNLGSPASHRIPSLLLSTVAFGPFRSVLQNVYYIREKRKRLRGCTRTMNLPKVDMQRSKAVMLTKSGMGVYLLDKTVRQKVLRVLNATSGIAWAKEREEVYNGRWVKGAPDILIYPEFDKGYNITHQLGFNPVFEGAVSDHHPLGIAIFAGKDVIPGKFSCQAMDITPSILSYLNLPQPSNSDGKTLDCLRYPGTGEHAEKFDYLSKWAVMVKIARIRKKLEGFSSYPKA